MESQQIWSKVQDKFAQILVLRGQEVHLLKVTGISLTLKRKVQGVLEALQQGQSPADAGAKPVETLDARAIRKAEVSPGNGSLTLHGEGDKPRKLTFSTADSDADGILQAILAQVRPHLRDDAGGDRGGRGPDPPRDRRGRGRAALGGSLPVRRQAGLRRGGRGRGPSPRLCSGC